MRFDSKRIIRFDKLGQGSFGTIYPYKKNPDDFRYVMKVSHDMEFEKLGKALQEVFIGFNLNHPAILAYKDFHIERSSETNNLFRLYIKMPRMKTSLKSLLQELKKSGKETLPKEILLEYIKTLLSGLKFLAERKIAHRDLKPANILINPQRQLVIADLGEAKHSLEEDTVESKIRCKGTIPYMAPEVLNSEERSNMKKKDLLKADVWSLGVTILHMCLLMEAKTSSLESMKAREVAIGQDLDEVKKKYERELPGLTGFIQSMLAFDKEKRKSIQDICEDFEAKFEKNVGITMPNPQSFSQGFIRNDPNQHQFHQNIYNLSFQQDYNMNIFNTFQSEKGEKEMTGRYADSFYFKFDKNPTISLPQGSEGSFSDRSVKFTDMIQQFSKTVEEHKIKFSNFNIEFSKFLDFTNQNLNQLLTELNKSLTNLKELSLNFSHCPRITNEGLEDLKNYFQKNPGLEKLSLNFDGNANFNQDSLKKLSSGIALYLGNLNSLTLSFENCPGIPHGEVRMLDSSLKKLTKLKDLSLNFKSCPGVGTTIRAHFEVTLKQSIENFTFEF